MNFKVANLGKVRSANVQLTPLSILVGKNNTGKSYVATLVWSLSNLETLLQSPEARSKRPKWYRDFVDVSGPASDKTLDIDAGKCSDIIKYVNDLFKRDGSSFLSHIFAHPGFQATSVAIENAGFVPFRVRASTVNEQARGTTEREELHIRFVDVADNPLLRVHFPLQYWRESPFFGDMIFEELVYNIISGFAESFARVTYIPAARTGLMLALSSLVTERFSVKDQSKSLDLPVPLVSFLQSIADPRAGYRSKSTSKLSSWLQDNIIGGSIKQDKKSGNSPFKYRPHGRELELPLHATSSMITELAPYLLSLNSEVKGRHFILEEPEAHLHLEAQRNMARAISRLLSAGAQVTLTTHSDTFMQQINNLMSLYAHPKKKALMQKFGYESVDLLNPADVSAYEFSESDGLTDVRRLENTPEGFVVSSLNETLLSLARETLAIREKTRA
nr:MULTISPECIES: AAA family ATPase [unclassified Rhizobium]